MQSKFNDGIVGKLQVRNFLSPPYISSDPEVASRKLEPEDRFVIIGSDGLFDYMDNDDLVDFTSKMIHTHPELCVSDLILEEVLNRAAMKHGIFEIPNFPFRALPTESLSSYSTCYP